MNPLITMPAAVGLGVLHALEPGHGKGVISAYLIATRGSIKDALLLGCISAAAHTFSIVALSLAVSETLRVFTPDAYLTWINLGSGLIIVGIGLSMLIRHFRPAVVSLGRLNGQKPHQHEHRHLFHTHSHDEDHAHEARTLGKIILVGLITGAIPCPSAMAIFLAAATADKIPLGLGLVTAFSVGSAFSMSLIGILSVRASRALVKMKSFGFVRSLNQLSSWTILFFGVMIMLHALNSLSPVA